MNVRMLTRLTEVGSIMQLRKDDTFTTKNIIDAYCSAFYSVHHKQPARIVHLGGKWFRVDADMRDRSWLMGEIERLRHQALTTDTENGTDTSGGRSRLMKIIRGLRKLTGMPATDDNDNNHTHYLSPEDTVLKRDSVRKLTQQVARPQERTNFQFGPRDTLILQLEGESIAVRAPELLVLGRDVNLDGGRGIDLTHYDADNRGVSRKHAQIAHISDSNYLEVIDLGSINGTYINGQLLEPLLGYPLYDGDTLNLGALEIKVRFTTGRV